MFEKISNEIKIEINVKEFVCDCSAGQLKYIFRDEWYVIEHGFGGKNDWLLLVEVWTHQCIHDFNNNI